MLVVKDKIAELFWEMSYIYTCMTSVIWIVHNISQLVRKDINLDFSVLIKAPDFPQKKRILDLTIDISYHRDQIFKFIYYDKGETCPIYKHASIIDLSCFPCIYL